MHACSNPQKADIARLVDLVGQALEIADCLGRTNAALHLNDALVDLSGEGRPPPDWDDEDGT